MSYANANSDRRRKVVTSGAVALIQAGLVLAVIKGFTVAFVQTEPPRHLPSQTFPTTPMPDPTQEPQVEPKKPVEQDTVIDRTVRTTIPTNERVDVPPLDPVAPTGPALTDTIYIPPVEPSDPPPRFAPKAAAPRNDTAGWVTANDYPAADLRQGHTGVVRFRLAIDGDGGVAGCTIVESSGYPGLDAATCRNVIKRARFRPATDTEGARVTGSYSGTIRWVIPQD